MRGVGRCLGWVVLAVLAGGVSSADAANNPGTGNTGFCTFRPAVPASGAQVNVASGNLLVAARDLGDSDANYHVVVDRVYNSRATDDFSILSPGWSYDVGPSTRLSVAASGDISLTGPTAYRISFARQFDGSYRAPAGFDGSLAQTGGGWTLTRQSVGDAFVFDAAGTLVATRDAAGREFTVQTTSAAGRTVLSSYGTASGRRANLSYTGDSLVRELDDPASGHHYYTHSAGHLTTYTAANGAQTSYAYDPNGLLQRITSPDGSTAEVTTAADGRVQQITATASGETAQTTSFDYAHRPGRTYVTGPDSVRRSYVYDDDYRVTRQYNPDVAPSVSASGPLYDLAEGYTQGNAPLDVTVSATEPDGAGLTRLAVETVSGSELGAAAPACVDSAFDHICPTTDAQTISANLPSLGEGRQLLRATAVDDEANRGLSANWAVIIDRTPPAFDGGLSASATLDPATGDAIVSWDAAVDHSLPDGTPGAGVSGYRARGRVGSGSWTDWQDVSLERLIVPGASPGAAVDVEIAPLDQAGNVAVAATATVTVTGEGDACDATANGFPAGCGDDGGSEDFAEPPVTLVPSGSGAARASAVAAYRYDIQIGGGGWSTIRRGFNSYVIGNAHDGWQFDQVRQNYTDTLGWITGRIYGDFGTCGWIQSEPATDGPDVMTGCEPNYRPHVNQFADQLNCRACNRGTPIQVLRPYPECRNVEPTPVDNVPTRCIDSISTRTTDDAVNRGTYVVSWRYTTNDNKFVLVRDTNISDPTHGVWVFIDRHAFDHQLCTTLSTKKYDCGSV